jgi:hypothetical protein
VLHPAFPLQLRAPGGSFCERVFSRRPEATVRQLPVDQKLNFSGPIVVARQELGVNVLMTLSETP